MTSIEEIDKNTEKLKKLESSTVDNIIFYDLEFEGSCFESRWESEFLRLEKFIDSLIQPSLEAKLKEQEEKKINQEEFYNTKESKAKKGIMSLFSKKGSKLQEEVKKNIKTVKNFKKTVVFVQNKRISEFESETRLKEIESNLRCQEFVKFLRFEHILSKLSIDSDIRWVYVMNNDCIGPFFSFALLCDKILSFDIKVKMGFQALQAGYLPPLGGRVEKEGLIQTIVENYQPVFTSYFAYKKHIFDYCGSYSSWREHIGLFLDLDTSLIRSDIVVSKKEIESIKKNTDRKFFKFCNLYGIQNIFDEEQVSSYSFYNSHIKHKFKSMSSLMRLVLLAYFNARQMYSFGYRSFLNEQIGFCKYSEENKKTYEQETKDQEIFGLDDKDLSLNKKVYIDLDQILPPLEPMLNLIKHGYQLIFFSKSSSVLSSLMDLFYLRLTNQELDLDVEKSFVYSRINWFVGQLRFKDGFILKWISNEEVVLSYKDQKSYVFNTIYKKDSVYLPNWCEFDSDCIDQPSGVIEKSINELISIMIKPPIITKMVDRLSLSLFIRSWFLEKLIKYAVKVELDVLDLLAVLEEFGWGVSSSDICWDKFMISRQEHFVAAGIDVYKDQIAIGKEILDPEILSMNVWKEVYIYSPKESKKQNLSKVNINIYFVNLARYIKNLIFKHHYVASSYLASQLVRECLGIDESSRYYLEKSGMYLK